MSPQFLHSFRLDTTEVKFEEINRSRQILTCRLAGESQQMFKACRGDGGRFTHLVETSDHTELVATLKPFIG